MYPELKKYINNRDFSDRVPKNHCANAFFIPFIQLYNNFVPLCNKDDYNYIAKGGVLPRLLEYSGYFQSNLSN
jgi:hypothetical protein